MTRVCVDLSDIKESVCVGIDGFIDLREYVKNTEWLCWLPKQNKYRFILIMGENKEIVLKRAEEFIDYIKKLNCVIYVKRGDIDKTTKIV